MSVDTPPGVKWWFDPLRHEYTAQHEHREQQLRVSEDDLYADAYRANKVRWSAMTSAEIAVAISEAWACRLAEWVLIVPWEPPDWIPAGADLSFLPAWVCHACQQRNTGWARECGRCQRTRPMDPLMPWST